MLDYEDGRDAGLRVNGHVGRIGTTMPEPISAHRPTEAVGSLSSLPEFAGSSFSAPLQSKGNDAPEFAAIQDHLAKLGDVARSGKQATAGMG